MSKEEMAEQAKNILNEIRARSKNDQSANELTFDHQLEQPAGADIFTVGNPIEDGREMIFAAPVPDNKIVISSDGRMMVSIDVLTGQIEFGEDYNFDGASHSFWTCMGKDSPTVLKAEIAELKEAARKLQESYCNDDMDAKKEYTFASSNNVELLVAKIKDEIYEIATAVVFKPNNQITRSQLTASLEEYLSLKQAQRFISQYTIVCDERNNSPDTVDNNELIAKIVIQPQSQGEYFLIPVYIKATGIDKEIKDALAVDASDIVDNFQFAEKAHKNAYDEDYVNASSYDNAMKFIE